MTTEPRVLVIGAGSAGSRHARHLVAAGARVSVMDSDPERAIDDVERLDLDLGLAGEFDAVVVASPSVYHRDQTLAVLEAGAHHVLVEKPLAVSVDGLDELVTTGHSRVAVAYNLRHFEPVVRFMDVARSDVIGQPHLVSAWFGSYLPDWRPNVDYRTTYSARSELGGGVLMDAIHELDLLVWLLGDGFRTLGGFVGRLGRLEIDVEDVVQALLLHDSGVVAHLSLDYLSRRYRRGLEIVGDAGTARIDWSHELVEWESATTRERCHDWEPVEASYERQARNLLGWLSGQAEPAVPVERGAESVLLASAIREHALRSATVGLREREAPRTGDVVNASERNLGA